ncbi:hypothetical protein HMPREF9318_01167 [Streptococcus urinalis FB127-CNA-2]|uniref:Redoxin n=1 Tax=Streptococcus urinalis 2285-97 TaxID=764291 RepID=G5KI41_9STRE|nr:TlpA disulfide reductase family protein [Streptococcus urinalis]EHJ57563.1 redoxin [Streptococcus urinalis 2285-97]EKS20529.1 hypothetical protein HMPREF9318_01167 [Streptococcus urinalis FB127-CNA-2]VEF31222.1 Thiol-disulfide oxidoreductase resA [Streptococcus urinalis]
MKKYKNLTILLIGLMLIIFSFFILNNKLTKHKDKTVTSNSVSSSYSNKESVRQELIDATLKKSDGTELHLQEFNDKPIFIVEWASWCPHCQKELPVIENLYQKYKDKIHFVMVNATDGQKETSASAKLYIETKKFTFPYYLDEKLSFAKQMNITEVPTMLFSTKSGQVLKTVKEEISQTDLEKELLSLISHQ